MKFSLPEILRSALLLGIGIAVGKFWTAGNASSGGEQKILAQSSAKSAFQSTPNGTAAPATTESTLHTMGRLWREMSTEARRAELEAIFKIPNMEERMAEFLIRVRSFDEADVLNAVQIIKKADKDGLLSARAWEYTVRHWARLKGEAAMNSDFGGATRKAAFAEVFSRLKHADKNAAAEFLTANASQPWRDDDSYAKHMASLAKNSPTSALEWAATLPPSPTTGTWPGARTALRNWEKENPAAAQAWLSALPAGSFRASLEKNK